MSTINLLVVLFFLFLFFLGLQTKVEVIGIDVDDEPAQFARCGDNVLLKLRGVEEDEVSTGFVLCQPSAPVMTTRIFDAQLIILDFKNIMCAGYTAVMHVHTLVEEVQIAVSAFPPQEQCMQKEKNWLNNQKQTGSQALD